MSENPSTDVTRLLRAWSDGQEEALEKLAPLVYDELHRMARRYMYGEQAGQTLQATALVNEAYLRLVDWENVQRFSAEGEFERFGDLPARLTAVIPHMNDFPVCIGKS